MRMWCYYRFLYYGNFLMLFLIVLVWLNHLLKLFIHTYKNHHGAVECGIYLNISMAFFLQRCTVLWWASNKLCYCTGNTSQNIVETLQQCLANYLEHFNIKSYFYTLKGQKKKLNKYVVLNDISMRSKCLQWLVILIVCKFPADSYPERNLKMSLCIISPKQLPIKINTLYLLCKIMPTFA